GTGGGPQTPASEWRGRRGSSGLLIMVQEKTSWHRFSVEQGMRPEGTAAVLERRRGRGVTPGRCWGVPGVVARILGPCSRAVAVIAAGGKTRPPWSSEQLHQRLRAAGAPVADRQQRGGSRSAAGHLRRHRRPDRP